MADSISWCYLWQWEFTDIASSAHIQINNWHTRMAHTQWHRILLCTDIVHEKKITGLPQTWVLTLSLQNLTLQNFCIHQRVCRTSREKKTSKHGINSVLVSSKTVSSISSKNGIFHPSLSCLVHLITVHSICELDAGLRDYNLSMHPRVQLGWNLYIEIELKIDDWAFLMAIKGQGDLLTVKP